MAGSVQQPIGAASTAPPPRCPAAPLRNSKKLMRLQAEPPARMGQAIAKCSGGVGLPFRSVHRLQIEVLELETLDIAGLSADPGETPASARPRRVPPGWHLPWG